jgi:hypothetical protein
MPTRQQRIFCQNARNFISQGDRFSIPPQMIFNGLVAVSIALAASLFYLEILWIYISIWVALLWILLSLLVVCVLVV